MGAEIGAVRGNASPRFGLLAQRGQQPRTSRRQAAARADREGLGRCVRRLAREGLRRRGRRQQRRDRGHRDLHRRPAPARTRCAPCGRTRVRPQPARLLLRAHRRGSELPLEPVRLQLGRRRLQRHRPARVPPSAATPRCRRPFRSAPGRRRSGTARGPRQTARPGDVRQNAGTDVLRLEFSSACCRRRSTSRTTT